MHRLTGKPLVPRLRTPTRPYAHKRNGPVSITTALNVLGKPLDWAASKEAATFAVLHRDEWESLPEDQAIDRIRKHFRGLWDGRAGMGTLVHAVNESWTWGETVDLDVLVRDLAHATSRPIRIWQGHEDETAAAAEGYVDGLAKFWAHFAPVTLATEEVVRHPDRANAYIGQRDWTLETGGRRLLVEIKTTAAQEADKGLYWDSWRLQLAAQRHAEEIVVYDAAGNEQRAEPNYPLDACAVLHLRGDGGYALYEVQAGMSEWARFLQTVGLHQWVNKESRTPVPVDLAPVRVMEEVA